MTIKIRTQLYYFPTITQTSQLNLEMMQNIKSRKIKMKVYLVVQQNIFIMVYSVVLLLYYFLPFSIFLIYFNTQPPSLITFNFVQLLKYYSFLVFCSHNYYYQQYQFITTFAVMVQSPLKQLTFFFVATSLLLLFVNTQNPLNIRSNQAGSNQKINRQFKGFDLFHEVPQTFVLNEVFRFNGQLRDPVFDGEMQAETIWVSVNFTQQNNSKISFECQQVIKWQNTKFDMSCRIIKKGTFSLQFIATFQTQQINTIKFQSNNPRNVIDLPQITVSTISPPQPEGLLLQLIDNKVFAKWKSQAAISNLTFYQTNKNNQTIKVQFLLSNFHRQLKIPFVQFIDFVAAKTTAEISHASSLDGSLSKISTPFSKQKISFNFQACNHQYIDEQPKSHISDPPLPTRLNIGQSFVSKITFSQLVLNYYYLTTPYFTISKVRYIQQKSKNLYQINKGISVQIELKFSSPGTYFIQTINNYQKSILNQPIYVGNVFPVLPSYTDYYDFTFRQDISQATFIDKYISRTVMGRPFFAPSFNATLKEQREYLLTILNTLRRNFGYAPLVFQQKLNEWSQKHAEDMKKNNYISYYNMQGQAPNQRASLSNIPYRIDQSVNAYNHLGKAIAQDIQYSHYLYQYATREFISVGMGIVQNGTQEQPSYIVSIDYAYRSVYRQPLTELQKRKLQDKILQVLFEKNPNVVKQNKQLSKDIEDWISKPTSKQISDLEKLLAEKQVYGKEIKVWSQKLKYETDELDVLRASRRYIIPDAIQVGIGIKMNNEKQFPQQPLTALIVFI